VAMPRAKTLGEDSFGVCHWSNQGISPLRLNVNLYQATYHMHKPVTPIMPIVKEDESQGPAGAYPMTKASRMSNAPTIAWIDASGALSAMYSRGLYTA